MYSSWKLSINIYCLEEINLFNLMDYVMQSNYVNKYSPFLYFKGPSIIISIKGCFPSLKILFYLGK